MAYMYTAVKKNDEWRRILPWFILLQPLVDILTALGIIYLDMQITVGIVVRALFLVFIMADLVIGGNLKKRKGVLIYVVLLGLYVLAFLGLVIYGDKMGPLFLNLKELFKVIYFPMTLIYFYQLSKEGKLRISKELLAKVLLIYMLIIFIGFVTGTGFSSYKSTEMGNKGWFFAGNDLTAILSLLIPIGFHVYVEKLLQTKQLLIRLASVMYLLLIVFCTTYIGTKSIYASTLFFFGLYGLYFIVKFIRTKKRREVYAVGVAFSMVFLMMASLTFAPIGKGFSSLRFKFSQVEFKEEKFDDQGELIVELPVDEDAIFEEFGDGEGSKVTDTKIYRISNALLSDRLDKSLAVHYGFVDGGLPTRLLGLGYYPDTKKIDLSTQVEVDFLSFLYRQGILGMILMLIPLFYVLAQGVKFSLRKFRKFIGSTPAVILSISVLWSMVFALITGHVLVSPAVSIFVSLVLILWLQEVRNLPAKGTRKERNR